jgi:hypothetical protein
MNFVNFQVARRLSESLSSRRTFANIRACPGARSYQSGVIGRWRSRVASSFMTWDLSLRRIGPAFAGSTRWLAIAAQSLTCDRQLAA